MAISRSSLVHWLSSTTLLIALFLLGMPVAFASDDAPKIGLIPRLNIDIPGLQFATVSKSDSGQLEVPFLAQYVSAVYNFLLGAALIAAAVMIVYGGFLYILGATMGSIEKGKSIIQDAIIGLVLVFGTYTLLATLNPATVRLTAIKVQKVQSPDIELMEKFFGFVDEGAQKASLDRVESTPTGATGAAPPNGVGENISLPPSLQSTVMTTSTILLTRVSRLLAIDEDERPPSETLVLPETLANSSPYRKLQNYCTSAADMSEASIDQKYSTLVKAVLGFSSVCKGQNACAYLRGGDTDISSGHVTAGASDVPFLISAINKQTDIKGTPWDANCSQKWGSPITIHSPSGDVTFTPASEIQKYYTYIQDPQLNMFNYKAKGTCFTQLQDVYQKKVGDFLTSKGIFGGDCGSTIAQIYVCAGGQTADKMSNLIPWYNKPRSSYHIVLDAKNMSDLKRQIQTADHLRFGDVVIIGSHDYQHNFLYTGGRADVPFAIFEMGGPGEPLGGSQTVLPNGTAGGIRLTPKSTSADNDEEALYTYIDKVNATLSRQDDGHGGKKSWFPVTIVRPYEFKSCTSKSECAEDETCQCSVSDALVKEGQDQNMIKNNTCSLHNICHKQVNAGISTTLGKGGCTNDEHCKNGEVCAGTPSFRRCAKP